MDRLTGKTAVVTGAASGIGRGLVEGCAERGMTIVAADVDRKGLERLAAELALGDRLVTQVVDVSDSDQVAALADCAFDHFGAVHLLFNNAGVLTTGKSWEQDPATWAWLVGVNLMGVVHGITHFVPRMIAGGAPGAVINTGSMAGLLASANLAPYTASKHAVVGLSECLLYELDSIGAPLKVSVICPGPVRTEIMHSDRLGADIDAHRAPAMRDAFDAGIKAHGMTPTALADIVFDHIARGEFWICPHPDMLSAVEARTRTLLAGEVPQYRPMEA